MQKRSNGSKFSCSRKKQKTTPPKKTMTAGGLEPGTETHLSVLSPTKEDKGKEASLRLFLESKFSYFPCFWSNSPEGLILLLQIQGTQLSL
jgi:hypothetical protein